LEPSQASTRILTISKAFFVEGQPFLNDLQGLWAEAVFISKIANRTSKRVMIKVLFFICIPLIAFVLQFEIPPKVQI
jgi:hypothetical protein